jgi:hypothetical protein
VDCHGADGRAVDLEMSNEKGAVSSVPSKATEMDD